MSLSFDVKLLGEKMDYYCSSSEEDDNLGDGDDDKKVESSSAALPANLAPQDFTSNTGPKGVIEDWRRYKQLESEKRREQDMERLELAKKLTLTCRSVGEDDREREKDDELMAKIEEKFDDLEEQFLEEYRKRRLEELRRKLDSVPTFGRVLELNRQNYLDTIDKENPLVPVIIHIFEKGVKACDTMNRCLDSLAEEHVTAKFCRISASEIQMSLNFAISGVPALLVYRNGELIGNFVKITDELGEEFHPCDIEGFLIENAMLPDEPSSVHKVIRTSAAPVDSDSD